MGPKGKAAAAEEAPAEQVETPPVVQNGYGKFEYVNQTLYVGEWKLTDDNRKVKHGQGKIVFPGTTNSVGVQVGGEEYEGGWDEDQMHGRGTYKFTSGNVYTGDWDNGVMSGQGRMIYGDGSTYEGNWSNNLMDGDGVYVDAARITWAGIFVGGQFDSKIQKKLQAEKVIKDKIIQFEQKAKAFFEQFADAFAKSDKKTFKENLAPFFGSTDNCIDYVNVESYPKFEDRTPDKWHELLKAMTEDSTFALKALSQKDDATILAHEQVLIDQLRSKPGGQLVECTCGAAKMVLCELQSEAWVMVAFAEGG